MEAIAHNKAFAKKVGVPQNVGQDFSNADKGKKFSKGGDTMDSKMKMFEKSGKDIDKKGMREGSKADMAMDKKQMMGMKKGGATKKMASGGMTEATMGKVKINPGNINGVAERGKTKGTQIKMAGSTPLGMKKGGMAKGKAC
jgi:hypothetical protein